MSYNEAYSLIQKSNRTTQEDKRLNELLLEINHNNQGFRYHQQQQRADSQPKTKIVSPEEKTAKINEFLNLYKDKPSNRYDSTDKPTKKINSRYGSLEERYDFG